MTLRLFDTNRYCKEEEKQGEIPKFGKISKDIMRIVWASLIEYWQVSLITLFNISLTPLSVSFVALLFINR